MLRETETALSDLGQQIRYEIIDAESIPHSDHTFDIIIANHMLYHVVNREKALSEIKRVLKPNGALYASTVGIHHMVELKTLIKAFDPDSNYDAVMGAIQANFCLESGAEQLKRYFPSVTLNAYQDSLIVTEAQPLVDYVLSCNGLNPGRMVLHPEQSEDFKRFILAKLQADGKIVISKPSGLFIGK